MFLSKFGVFAQGANHPAVDFLLMCALKSLLLWIICVQRKKSIKSRIGVCASTSYLDRCILRTYTDVPNNAFGLPTLDYLHIQASTLGHGLFCVRKHIFQK